MFGILLTGHDPLPQAFADVAQRMLGCQPHLACVPYHIGEAVEPYEAELREGIKAMDAPGGVAILSDVYGGIPYNTALVLADGVHMQVFSDLDLAMLLRLLAARTAGKSLHEAVGEWHN